MVNKRYLPQIVFGIIFVLFLIITFIRLDLYLVRIDFPSVEIEQARLLYELGSIWIVTAVVGVTLGYSIGVILQFFLELPHSSLHSWKYFIRAIFGFIISIATLFWKALGIMLFSENRETIYLFKIVLISTFQWWGILISSFSFGVLIGIHIHLLNKIEL